MVVIEPTDICLVLAPISQKTRRKPIGLGVGEAHVEYCHVRLLRLDSHTVNWAEWSGPCLDVHQRGKTPQTPVIGGFLEDGQHVVATGQ